MSMLMMTLNWVTLPFVLAILFFDVANGIRNSPAEDSLLATSMFERSNHNTSMVEPFSLLLRAQALWSLGVRQHAEGLTGSFMESTIYERTKGQEETEKMAEYVERLFQKVKYGLHNFMEATEDNVTAYATCTGSATDKPEMTLLSLVSIAAPEEYARLLNANRIKHAEMHGMQYCAYNHPLGEHRHVNRVISKLSAVKALHDLGHSAVVWMDADAVIMNHARDFKDVMDEHVDKDIVWSTDFDEQREDIPTASSTINSGVFIMKKAAFTKKLLESCTKYQVEKSTDLTNNPDQTAIKAFRKANPEEFNSHVAIIPWVTMNSLATQYKAGDFVVHMAGGDHLTHKYFTLVDKYMHDSMSDIVQ